MLCTSRKAELGRILGRRDDGNAKCLEPADSSGLFERDWEVFVVKRDPASGSFAAFTACCDDAVAKADQC